MSVVIGIDPGLSGAIIAIDRGRVQSCLDMPTIEVRGKRRINGHAIHDWIVVHGPVDMVIVEEVQGVQGTGATSAFTFGHGAGLLEGILIASQRPYTLVRPQVWTKKLGVTRDKGAHRQLAQRLYPHNSALFDRVRDDGRADAALIAHWWGMR